MGSARKKLKKFAEVHQMKNVLEMKDKFLSSKIWRRNVGREKIILELACGRGEYALYLAEANPKTSVWGIDIQGERLWYGAKSAIAKNIRNLNFLRTNIEKLDQYFKTKSIDEIWITFPDPFPKEKKQSRRLTSNHFLNIYSRLLKPCGKIHLKTDDENFFDWSVEQFEANQSFTIQKIIKDIYVKDNLGDELKIKTNFEEKHLANNKKIFYLQTKTRS
jgi:tRNA (guanine-N7-)-methyltransferase